MMTWTLACGMADAFAGFVPMSGTFWAPVPEECPGRATNILHIHGIADDVVPLEGRPIGEARQAAVTDALEMYATHGGFAPAGSTEAPGGMTCTFQVNPAGRSLGLCLFDGGHSFSAERLEWAIHRILGEA
jgi:polyhydroxybutyrate depolymerase